MITLSEKYVHFFLVNLYSYETIPSSTTHCYRSGISVNSSTKAFVYNLLDKINFIFLLQGQSYIYL
jgi:hypothetical protein